MQEEHIEITQTVQNNNDRKDETTQTIETNNDRFDNPYITKNTTKTDKSILINITRPVGVNTISSNLRETTLDIRELPNPKNAVSPWANSSFEPDMNPINQSLCK